MNREQLNKGNELSNQLSQLDYSKKQICKVLKEAKVDEFCQNTINVRLDNTDCRINTARFVGYLEKELSIIEQEIVDKQKEFEQV